MGCANGPDGRAPQAAIDRFGSGSGSSTATVDGAGDPCAQHGLPAGHSARPLRGIEPPLRRRPGVIVRDESVGQWIMRLLPRWGWIAAAFFLFRLFDVWKPWPVSWADRSVAGGLGVMPDDVLAASTRRSR